MTSHTERPHLRVACVGVLFLLGSLGGAYTGGDGDRPIFSGQATAVQAKVLGVQLPPLADTGYFEAPEFLPPAPCTEESISIDNLSVAAEILCASTRGKGDHSMSNAHVAELNADVAGIPVTVEVLRSDAKAGCNVLTPVLSGRAHVLKAQVGPVIVDADPLLPTPRNQPVSIPGTGAYFIIAEQTTSFNGNRGDITLTALRVVVPGLLPGTDTDVSFARAHADVICQGRPVCPGPGFVTGGGFLNGSDGKQHFVIAFRDGDRDWGHLMYSDKASGVKMRAATFTSANVYPVTGADGGGTLTGETTSGSFFQSKIIDAGEPGRNDWFELFSPKEKMLASGNLDGGNIQVHKACKTQ